MKPNKAGKHMWLQAQVANQNMKQNGQTQDADGMQAFFCIIYDAVRGYISTPILLIGDSEPTAPTLRLRLPPQDIQHFKIKTV